MNKPQPSPTIQPANPPGAGTLRVVSGSDYLRRQEELKQRLATVLLAPILVLWLGSLLLSFGLIALTVARAAHLIAWTVSPRLGLVALGAILIDLVLMPAVQRLVEQRDQYRLGRRGEDATAWALQRLLDEQWTLFRNVVLPDSRGDIDAVLLGPGGLLVLEVKSYNGQFRVRGDIWQRRFGPSWRRLSSSPSRQARWNRDRLCAFLAAACGIDIRGEPRVVWAGPGKLHLHGKPSVYVWYLDNMPDYTLALTQRVTLSGPLLQRARAALLTLPTSGGLANTPPRD